MVRDDELKSMENPSLERGCTLAPILEPQVYILANGTAGIKMVIDMVHPIQVADHAGFATDGEPEKVYSADMF